MNGRVLILFVFVLTLVIGYSEGALPPPSAKFSFQVHDEIIGEGDWRLYFVLIPNYGFADLGGTKDYFMLMMDEYIRIKELCGSPDNYEYADFGNGRSRLIVTTEECNPYAGYVHVSPERLLTFERFHYFYPIEVSGRPSDYPVYCEISDGRCEFMTFEIANENPHFLVLEKIGSEEHIYFSDATIVPWNYYQEVEWLPLGGTVETWRGETYLLELKDFRAEKPNKLIIRFEGGHDDFIVDLNKRLLPWYYQPGFLITLLLVVVILAFAVIKKMKRQS